MKAVVPACMILIPALRGPAHADDPADVVRRCRVKALGIGGRPKIVVEIDGEGNVVQTSVRQVNEIVRKKRKQLGEDVERDAEAAR